MSEQQMYDSLEAEKFIAERTGEPPEIVHQFLEAKFRHEELTGITTPVNDDDIVDGEGCVERFVEEHIVNPNEVSAYIQKVTRLGATRVANMMAEEVAYMATLNLVEPGAYAVAQAWAQHCAQA